MHRSPPIPDRKHTLRENIVIPSSSPQSVFTEPKIVPRPGSTSNISETELKNKTKLEITESKIEFPPPLPIKTNIMNTAPTNNYICTVDDIIGSLPTFFGTYDEFLALQAKNLTLGESYTPINIFLDKLERLFPGDQQRNQLTGINRKATGSAKNILTTLWEENNTWSNFYTKCIQIYSLNEISIIKQELEFPTLSRNKGESILDFLNRLLNLAKEIQKTNPEFNVQKNVSNCIKRWAPKEILYKIKNITDPFQLVKEVMTEINRKKYNIPTFAIHDEKVDQDIVTIRKVRDDNNQLSGNYNFRSENDTNLNPYRNPNYGGNNYRNINNLRSFGNNFESHRQYNIPNNFTNRQHFSRNYTNQDNFANNQRNYTNYRMNNNQQVWAQRNNGYNNYRNNFNNYNQPRYNNMRPINNQNYYPRYTGNGYQNRNNNVMRYESINRNPNQQFNRQNTNNVNNGRYNERNSQQNNNYRARQEFTRNAPNQNNTRQNNNNFNTNNNNVRTAYHQARNNNSGQRGKQTQNNNTSSQY